MSISDHRRYRHGCGGTLAEGCGCFSSWTWTRDTRMNRTLYSSSLLPIALICSNLIRALISVWHVMAWWCLPFQDRPQNIVTKRYQHQEVTIMAAQSPLRTTPSPNPPNSVTPLQIVSRVASELAGPFLCTSQISEITSLISSFRLQQRSACHWKSMERPAFGCHVRPQHLTHTWNSIMQQKANQQQRHLVAQPKHICIIPEPLQVHGIRDPDPR